MGPEKKDHIVQEHLAGHTHSEQVSVSFKSCQGQVVKEELSCRFEGEAGQQLCLFDSIACQVRMKLIPFTLVFNCNYFSFTVGLTFPLQGKRKLEKVNSLYFSIYP